MSNIELFCLSRTEFVYKEFELETNPLVEAESSCIWLGSAKGQARDTRRAQVFADHELRGCNTVRLELLPADWRLCFSTANA
jgi:hypothetical protein